MQATSTPTLAQPKSGAFAALGGAVILAAAVGVGAIIGVNLAQSAAPAGEAANGAAYALHVQRSGEIGALTAAQRGLLLQRQGEINAGKADSYVPSIVQPVDVMPKVEREVFTTPTGTTIFRIGGRDPMATFNGYNVNPGAVRIPYPSYPWVLSPVVRGSQLYPSVPWVSTPDAGAGNTDSVGISHR